MELTNIALGAIVVSIIGGASLVAVRVRKLEQVVFNGLREEMRATRKLVNWLFQDTLAQARLQGRAVPGPIPADGADEFDTAEIPPAPPERAG